MTTAAIILAGGLSSRMGRDKSELTIDNENLLDRAKRKFEVFGLHSIFVSGDRFDIHDINAHHGPLSAVLSCLIFMQDNHPEFNHLIFVPVDMPGLSTETLKHLAQHAEEQVHCYETNNFPFIIPVNEHIVASIKSQLSSQNKKEHSITDWMKHLDVVKLSFEGRRFEFTDTNTPEEWREYIAAS